jgi:hypothetical protein
VRRTRRRQQPKWLQLSLAKCLGKQMMKRASLVLGEAASGRPTPQGSQIEG